MMQVCGGSPNLGGWGLGDRFLVYLRQGGRPAVPFVIQRVTGGFPPSVLGGGVLFLCFEGLLCSAFGSPAVKERQSDLSGTLVRVH
jgi:hypothetical protein